MARKILSVTELSVGQWAGHVIAVCDDGAAFVGNLALLFATGSSSNWIRVPDVPQVPVRSVEAPEAARAPAGGPTDGAADQLKRATRPGKSF